MTVYDYREECLGGVILVDVHKLFKVKLLSARNLEYIIQVQLDLFLAFHPVLEFITMKNLIK
jgi:Na+/glutamate symporter